MRRAIDGVYGRSRGALIHGIQRKIRSSPEVLYVQVAGTVLGLRQRDRQLPEPEAAGFEVVDREAWLQEVEPGWTKLGGLLDRLGDQRSEKRHWCTVRQGELKDFKAVLGRGRRLVKAAYEFGGLDQRARKDLYSYAEVRQLSRRARQRRRERKQKRLAGPETELAGPETEPILQRRTAAGSFLANLRDTARRWLPGRRKPESPS